MAEATQPTLGQLARYFLRLGSLGFGGPVALCGQMERELVQERHWLTKEEMRDSIAVCQSLPGPLAIQVGIFASYLRGGFWGAWVGGFSFILPNFLMVMAAAAFYVALGGLSWVTAIFYGVSPVVIALILHSCYRLARLGMESWLQWAIAVAACTVTVALEAEVALVFIAAGLLGAVYYGLLKRPGGHVAALLAAPPVYAQSVAAQAAAGVAASGAASGVAATSAAGTDVLARLFLFFIKAGALTFGSGLVIVPFLEKGLVHQTGWLDERQFLVAVAVGMISPGPVVITATFVGYLVAGWLGSLVATLGIFLPSFLLVLMVAPLLLRYREQPYVKGFVQGAYAAAIGTILGAGWLLGKVAIGDWLTALVALAGLAVLFRFKVSSYVLVGAAAAVGLVAYPLIQPTWMLLK